MAPTCHIWTHINLKDISTGIEMMCECTELAVVVTCFSAGNFSMLV